MAKNTDDMLTKINDKLDDVYAVTYKIDKEVALQKAAFEEHTKKDEHMYEELKRMNDILQQNTDSLKDHILRTNILQEAVGNVENRILPIEKIHIESEAIKKYQHSQIVKWGKIIATVAALIGAIVAVLKLVH